MFKATFKESVLSEFERSELSQFKNLLRSVNKRWIYFMSALCVITMIGAFIHAGWAVYDYLEVSFSSKIDINLHSHNIRFFKYPTDVYKKHNDPFGEPFPAVTVCNLNPMRQSAEDYIRDLRELVSVFLFLHKNLSNITQHFFFYSCYSRSFCYNLIIRLLNIKNLFVSTKNASLKKHFQKILF